jgi:hypothetical protein
MYAIDYVSEQILGAQPTKVASPWVDNDRLCKSIDGRAKICGLRRFWV